MAESPEQPVQALQGIKVVDFTRHLAGPLLTRMLSDYGADVIKVESAPRGDPMRHVGSRFVAGENVMFLQWNRGKRSIVVDLRKPAAAAVVARLVGTADVLVENFRPGVADQMGIGYAAMSALNRKLVYCSITAYGPHGPMASEKGMDPVLQAFGGLLAVTGEAERPPVLIGVPVVDVGTAMTAFQAILLGLLARDRIGRGQHVQTSMLATAVNMWGTRMPEFWATGKNPARFGSAHSTTIPYKIFKTADGYAVAGVWQDEDWPGFCDIVERPDLKTDARFLKKSDRLANRTVLEATLDEVFVTRSTADWEARFRAGHGLFGRVQAFSEVMSHPQMAALGLVREMVHPKAGAMPTLGPIIDLSETPGGVTTPAPLLGEHSGAVLAELGYSREEIAGLLDAGVVLGTGAG